MQLEYRTLAEVRATGRVLHGLAAPYGRPAALPGYTERIAPGSFSRVLRERASVLLLRDHDMRALLARTSNGSLTLEDTSDGLQFHAELAQFTLADDTLAQVRSNLLAGMSIGFHARAEQWNSARTERTLTDIELVEISAVGPAVAYEGTSIAARARSVDLQSLSVDGRRRMLAVL